MNSKKFEKSIESAASFIGGIEKFIQKNDTILLKPNYNTADPFLGSSDPNFITTIIELLYEVGTGKVIIGERSAYLDTWKVLEKAGLLKVAEETGAEVRIFGKKCLACNF